MNHYVILSEGAYSDYSPRYFVGPVPITKAELNEKGESVGDSILSSGVNEYNRTELWMEAMQKWLDEKGYHPLPEHIPEINIYYDIPTSRSEE